MNTRYVLTLCTALIIGGALITGSAYAVGQALRGLCADPLRVYGAACLGLCRDCERYATGWGAGVSSW